MILVAEAIYSTKKASYNLKGSMTVIIKLHSSYTDFGKHTCGVPESSIEGHAVISKLGKIKVHYVIIVDCTIQVSKFYLSNNCGKCVCSL